MNLTHSEPQGHLGEHVGSAAAGRPLDVVVIGAGQAGLAMAWYLARRRVRYLLVDSNPVVGAAWRGRWDSLRLFSPAQYDGLPGSDFPAAADTYPGKDDVADFLASYAERNAFPILTGTTVTRLRCRPAASPCTPPRGTIAARQVVVAAGAFQQPYVPALSRSLSGVPQLHSAAYRRPADLPAGRVLVVGAANSGLQIAEDLLATHAVTVAVGANPPSVPQRIAGHDLFWWLTWLGLMNKGPESRLAKRVRARGDLVIGISRRALASAGVDFRPWMAAASGRLAQFADGTRPPASARDQDKTRVGHPRCVSDSGDGTARWAAFR